MPDITRQGARWFRRPESVAGSGRADAAVRLDAADAAELAELLQFLTGWLARDPRPSRRPLEEFAGNPACNIGQLRDDLERFTFPLGGSDGEQLFGP